jgi:hypothetical protein
MKNKTSLKPLAALSAPILKTQLAFAEQPQA